MEKQLDYNRACWASRRGMLELDLVLEPFVKECYPGLSTSDQQRYCKLLECEDTELFGWFLGRLRPEDEDLASIVDDILAFARRPA
ncbi:MAG: succinate dehydrogenase assembly factor 2 [Halieaceae bacterium]|jgi:antitoxin CptB|nr:succinate dehydrogenase assembly factor 2 [Halieaceae bacterium]